MIVDWSGLSSTSSSEGLVEVFGGVTVGSVYFTQWLVDRNMAPCSSNGTVDADTVSLLQDIANRLRIDSIKATNASNSG